MAKAEKLSSGNWRVRVFDYKDENGKNHYKSITAPTKGECQIKAAEYLRDRKQRQEGKITVRSAIEAYIDMSAPILSPTTIYAYDKVKRYAFQEIMDRKVDSLTSVDVQKAINIESERRTYSGSKISPKTVKNEWGLVAAALKSVCERSYNVKLPKVQKQKRTLPEPAEIIEAVKGTDIELPCLLAMWMGLRMSELKGITKDSIREKVLSVNKVMVYADGREIIKPYAKTDTSIRDLQIPDYIMSLIKQTKGWENGGLIVDMTRFQIYYRFKALELGITFHDLRHVFASVMLSQLGLPEKIVQEEGGWKTDSVMKTVYSNSFSSLRQESDEARDEFFNSLM